MELANKKAHVGKESIEDGNQLSKLATEAKPANLVQKPARIKAKKPRMIVRNLPFRCTVDDLKAVFLPFGNLVDCKVPLKENGKACGFGFVEYESVKIAENVVFEYVYSTYNRQ
jgi:nucleolar protein 4